MRKEGFDFRLSLLLLIAGLGPRNLFDWDGSRPPYSGLLAFQEADAAIFFGRDAEIHRGLDALNRLRRFGVARLVLLLGGSVSGKSSLVPLSDDKGRILVVAHEALFNAWEQPKSWLDEDRDNIHLQDGIRRAAQEWNTGGREIQFLVHRGTRLEAAEALARQPRFEVDTVARDYVQACVNLREAERETEL